MHTRRVALVMQMSRCSAIEAMRGRLPVYVYPLQSKLHPGNLTNPVVLPPKLAVARAMQPCTRDL